MTGNRPARFGKGPTEKDPPHGHLASGLLHSASGLGKRTRGNLGTAPQADSTGGGTMALRWCAAGMLEADHQFRRVNGRLHLPKLRAALEEHFNKNAGAGCHDETVNAA